MCVAFECVHGDAQVRVRCGVVGMNGTPVPQVVWLVSGYDLREHAFRETAAGDQFLQALCSHTVPPDKVTDQAGSALRLERCMPCQLNLGGILADQQQHDERWSSGNG